VARACGESNRVLTVREGCKPGRRAGGVQAFTEGARYGNTRVRARENTHFNERTYFDEKHASWSMGDAWTMIVPS